MLIFDKQVMDLWNKQAVKMYGHYAYPLRNTHLY